MIKKNLAKLPNLFIVGTAKSGTTSIAHYLKQHPNVYVSPIKEPFFFSTDINKGDFRFQYLRNFAFNTDRYFKKKKLPEKGIAHIDKLSQYLELFREVKNEKVICELSTGYLYSNIAADNIFKFNPEAKIVMILRQPVDRAYSHYLMDQRGFENSNLEFIDALKCDFSKKEKGWGRSNLYVELGLYFDQVSRYKNVFPESQIKIFLYEDLKNDPDSFMIDLCKFIDVDPSLFYVSSGAENRNIAKIPRFKVPNVRTHIIFRFIRSVITIIPTKLKGPLINIFFTSKNIPKLSKKDFVQAMPYFAEDIQKLSVLIKRNLQSWY